MKIEAANAMKFDIKGKPPSHLDIQAKRKEISKTSEAINKELFEVSKRFIYISVILASLSFSSLIGVTRSIAEHSSSSTAAIGWILSLLGSSIVSFIILSSGHRKDIKRYGPASFLSTIPIASLTSCIAYLSYATLFYLSSINDASLSPIGILPPFISAFLSVPIAFLLLSYVEGLFSAKDLPLLNDLDDIGIEKYSRVKDLMEDGDIEAYVSKIALEGRPLTNIEYTMINQHKPESEVPVSPYESIYGKPNSSSKQ